MEKINKYNKEFLKIALIPIFQKDKKFYIGKIPAKYFLNMFTVEPAEYDIEKEILFAQKFKDDNTYYTHLIKSLEKRLEDKPFERKEEKTRVKQIEKFLNNEEYALFPNTIIVSCDLINEEFGIPDGTKFDDLKNFDIDFGENMTLSFLDTSEHITYLYIPYQAKSILIIDGQHRLKGLQQARSEVKDSYDLLVSFIIGYNRGIIAKLFYTINYTQKSVNKSLLYHLSGEFSRELDEITFLHETVKILNEIDSSPFKKRIKMLGSIPRNITPEEKEQMTISQAFLIDYLIMSISKSAINSIYQPIFLYYYKDVKLQIEIIRFIIKYFRAIRSLNENDWNDPTNSILCKTIGIGAFIRVMHFVFVKMYIDEFKNDFLKIKKVTENDLKSKLDGIQNIDFSKSGAYAGGGSVGTLNKLKEEIIEKMAYFQKNTYSDFLDKYKSNYLKSFKKSLG